MATEMTIKAGAMDASHAENLVRVMETAVGVQRRYQFFVWSQSSLQTLLPHHLAICGSWKRARKQVQLEAFNSIFIPATVLATLTDGQSALMLRAVGAWIENGGRPFVLDLATLAGRSIDQPRDEMLDVGFTELLIHGVSRPQRINELESLFMFSSPGQRVTERQRVYLELLMPHIHATYLRVQSVEREMNESPLPPPAREGFSRSTITEREKQILGWVREGMSNHEIGTELGISPLTVKNHVQKILRKLGAANRAQAVARAMTLNLLGRSSSEG
jgi:transcriptional regulator EpsA